MFSNKGLIGLDIGSDSIKLVEIAHEKSSFSLSTYGIARHSIVLEGYWDGSKLRQIGTIIEDILSSGNFAEIKTVMSVMSKDVYVTTMDFDINWDTSQIQEEIDKQAPYFLPYPRDEMRLSFNSIKTDPRITNYTGKQRVIVNALPHFVIENNKNLLEHVNLEGVAFENQTISQIRSSLNPDAGNTVLMDVGGKSTTFSIVVNGVLRSSSYIPVGADKINRDFSEALGVDEIVAEYFKKDITLVNLYHLPEQIINALSILKSELSTFIDLNRKIAQAPQKVVITGGGVYTPGFIEFFRDLEIPVYIANVYKDIKIPPNLHSYVSPVSSQLCTAIGLALYSDGG